MAGPVVEGTYTATASGVTTWDITGVVIPSGLTDGLLIVGNSYEYGNNGAESNVTGVQIDPGGANQADFTRINNASVFGSYGNEASLWYLADANIPPAGTYTIRVTTDLPSGYAYTVYAASGCYVLSGAKQTGIPDAQNTQTATASTGVTTSLTTTVSDTLLLGSYSQGDNNAPTANSGQTVRWDLASGTSRGTSSSKVVSSAGSESLGYTHASSNRVAHAIAALAPSTTASTVTPADGVVDIAGTLASIGLGLTPVAGVLSVTGLAQSIELTVSPAPGTTSVTGASPTVQTDTVVSSAPGAGTLSVVGLTPAVQVGLSPQEGTVESAGAAPSVTEEQTVSPASGALEASGAAVSLGLEEQPATGEIRVSGQSPSIEAVVSVAPDVGQVVVSGGTAVVDTSETAVPGLGIVRADGSVATIEVTVTVPVGLIRVAGETVIVTAGPTLSPVAGIVEIVGAAPQVDTRRWVPAAAAGDGWTRSGGGSGTWTPDPGSGGGWTRS